MDATDSNADTLLAKYGRQTDRLENAITQVNFLLNIVVSLKTGRYTLDDVQYDGQNLTVPSDNELAERAQYAEAKAQTAVAGDIGELPTTYAGPVPRAPRAKKATTLPKNVVPIRPTTKK